MPPKGSLAEASLFVLFMELPFTVRTPGRAGPEGPGRAGGAFDRQSPLPVTVIMPRSAASGYCGGAVSQSGSLSSVVLAPRASDPHVRQSPVEGEGGGASQQRGSAPWFRSLSLGDHARRLQWLHAPQSVNGGTPTPLSPQQAPTSGCRRALAVVGEPED
jgi:hypothetical protein